MTNNVTTATPDGRRPALQAVTPNSRLSLQLLSRGLRIDYIGFVLVAAGLGSLEFVLDEGQRKNWFGSSVILGFARTAAFCLTRLFPGN
jgi:hypothetical protein